MKIITVLGGLGFIGSQFVYDCLEKGWYVRVIDKCTYAANMDVLRQFEFGIHKERFDFIKQDINDIKYFNPCDYVVNFAAESHVANSIVDSSEFIHTNINGVHNVLEVLKNYSNESTVRPIYIHISTDEVYGDIVSGAHKETDQLKPSNPYSASKAAGDMMVMAWGRTFKLPYKIVRPTNNYGPNQHPEKLIPKAVKALMFGQQIPLHNNGSPVRNWLHIKDTSSAIITLMEKGALNGIYNISGGFAQSNLSTVSQIISEYALYNNQPMPEIYDCLDLSYSRPGQDMRYALDDKILRKLGWAPVMIFKNEISGLVKHYIENMKW